IGAIGVIELKEAVDAVTIQQQFVDQGVWVRPFGKLVYTMPPYTMDNDTLATLTAAMVNVVAAHGKV
ncbi:MAG: aminotransferase class III-fold pyridoxal phosphate-dependent enzyme, partial [Pseudomonadales bacterium]